MLPIPVIGATMFLDGKCVAKGNINIPRARSRSIGAPLSWVSEEKIETVSASHETAKPAKTCSLSTRCTQFADDAPTPRVSTRERTKRKYISIWPQHTCSVNDGGGGRTLTPSTRWCLATRLTYSSLFAEVTALRDPPGMRSTCANEPTRWRNRPGGNKTKTAAGELKETAIYANGNQNKQSKRAEI